jgi:hypothetical protein
MGFAREVGVTQRGVGVTLDRISAIIKTKRTGRLGAGGAHSHEGSAL